MERRVKPGRSSTRMTPDEMSQRLLYRDGLMLIIDKPAGLSVHRGPKGGASLEDHFDLLRFGLPKPPALAHRLDKETSGCLVLGRHRKALAMLGDLFRFDKIGKTYWAMVEGGPAEDTGRIDLPLAKRDDNRGWWMKADPAGLPSETHWTVLGRAEGLTWLALKPITGRTHQLRVHCAATGFPILGDDIYGNEVHTRTLRNQNAPHTPGPGLHLHARSIEVPLYKNKPAIRVSAPVPAHMRLRLAACGWTGEASDSAESAAPSRPHPEEPAKQASRRTGPPSSFETRPAAAPQDEGGVIERASKDQ